MQVFLSSTVYDLIDVRSEVAELLRSMGIRPLLSDDKLSDFKVRQSTNSIETCLVNLEAADEVIVILDKRYGPSLESSGYDDISATHLEYNHAVKHKKPLHVFVRDRLAADFSIWKKNKRSTDLKLPWIDKKDYGLFDVLSKHSKLVRKASSTNWYTPFTSSVDLKSAISKRFEPRILPSRLFEAIASNRFPLFDIKQVTNTDVNSIVNSKITLTNVGSVPAFDCSVRWEDKERTSSPEIVAPGRTLEMNSVDAIENNYLDVTKYLRLDYISPIGIAVEDRFEIGHSTPVSQLNVLIHRAIRIERKFKRVPDFTIHIEDL